ncbi:hypothetical protein PIB30_058336 [Stylosanthes scabra]|uniref:Uncharacterized protein n=1 Tax=Stylosanthes scabra TaxID=79078 RepID=A0ABU6YKL2_9FABA|nr:hypothetical protein [Stylosanthes scabra]
MGVSVPNPVEECPKLIEFPPSTVPTQVETPIPVDVDSPPDVGLPPKSPQKTQPHSPNQNSEKEIPPKLPKSTKNSQRLGTSSNTNSSQTNCAPQKCASPKSAMPKFAKLNSTKPTTTRPNSMKPSHAKTNSSAQPNFDKPNSKPNAKPQTRSATRVSPRKGKNVVQTPTIGDDGSSSSDSYDSVEDNLYMPRADELSSEDEDDFIVTQARKKDCKRKNGVGNDLRKAREEIMVEDDGLVVGSNSDIDLGEVFGNETNVGGEADAYDAHDADSDGKDSWESLEMKTPPNSEDEDNAVDNEIPLFREGVKY